MKNRIRHIITSPKRLVTYCLYIAFMVFIVVYNIKNLTDKSQTSIDNFKAYYSSGLFVMIGLVMYSMLKKSSLNFKLSDINLLFTAPIDPRKIMVFNLIKRIPLYIVTSLYTLVFILSMVLGSVTTSMAAVLVTCLAYALVFLIVEPMSFSLFALSVKLKKPDLQTKVVQTILVLLMGMVTYSLYDAYSLYGLNVESLLAGLNHRVLNYIPILGWARYIMLALVDGVNTMTYICLGLMLATYLTLVATTFFWSRDYYEDVLASSEDKAKTVQAYKANKSLQLNIGFNKKNVSIRDDQVYAGALNWKRKLMIKKRDISLYVSIQTCCLLGALVGLRIIFGPGYMKTGLYMVAGAYVYLHFIFASSNNLDQEISKPYFFLLPDTGRKKIVQVLKTDLERVMINGYLMVIVHSLAHQSLRLDWLFMPITLTTTMAIFFFSSILVHLFLPGGDAKRFQVMVKMVQVLVLLLPSILVMALVGLASQSLLAVLICGGLVNGCVAGLLVFLSEKIMSKLEMK